MSTLCLASFSWNDVFEILLECCINHLFVLFIAKEYSVIYRIHSLLIHSFICWSAFGLLPILMK